MTALKPMVHQTVTATSEIHAHGCVGRPRGVVGQPQGAEQPVDHAEGGVEQVAPHQTDDRDAQHERREEDRAEEGAARELPVEQDREQQRQDDEERHADDDEDGRRLHAVPERLELRRPAVEQLGVVLQADEGLVGQQEVPVVQRDPDAEDTRDGDEGDEEEQERGEEQVGRPPRAVDAGCRSSGATPTRRGRHPRGGSRRLCRGHSHGVTRRTSWRWPPGSWSRDRRRRTGPSSGPVRRGRLR